MQYPIRRQDRALTAPQAVEVLERCEVCRLAFADHPAPYLVPMSFGIVQEGDSLLLYFHCAAQGRKLTLLDRNPAVAFEADRMLSLVRADQPCGWGMAYESVIGEGLLARVEDPQEKRRALAALMRHYGGEDSGAFSDEALGRVVILRLRVTAISGKSRPVPPDP